MGATVNIIETETDEVVESIPCKSLFEAEKVERGANINLNHSKFHTEIEEDSNAKG